MGSKLKKTQGRKRLLLQLVMVSIIVLSCWLVWIRFRTHPLAKRSVRHEDHLKAVSEEVPKPQFQSQATSQKPLAPPASTEFHKEEHAEYEGELLKDGWNHLQDSAEACSAACVKTAGCNVWVWCGREDGCGPERRYRQCWLKKQRELNLLYIRGDRNPVNPWTSGATYTDQMMKEVQDRESKRLETFKQDKSLPMVFLDVAIKGTFIGRITFVLFSRESPRAAENFRALCTGEKGIVPAGKEGAGLPYHVKGKAFYRIIDRFIDQTGAGTESVFGGYFKDDVGGLKLRHDRRGLLSMANAGPDTNTSHFSIMIGPAPHLNGHYTIFGEVVAGFEVVEAINKLSRGQPNNFAGVEAGAVIVDSGQIRCGEPCGAPDLYKEANIAKQA